MIRNINLIKKLSFLIFCSLALLMIAFTSCNSYMDAGVYRTSDTKMIDEYMATDGSNLDLFLSIVDKAGLRGMLHAYGTYTCFAPADDAVETYLTKQGLTINTMTQAQAAKIVKFHMVSDTIPTSDFIEGRLSKANMEDTYLVTQTQDDASILVNRQGTITQKNISCGNGYIQVVNKVLEPENRTVSQFFSALGDDYSVMKHIAEKISAAGYSLDDIFNGTDTTGYRTLLIQNNAAFTNAGFSISDLDAFDTSFMTELTDNATTTTVPNELLRDWLAYHVLPTRSYVTDMISSSSLNTTVTNQPLTFVYRNDSLLVNEFKLGELNENGILVDRQNTYTDYTCTNGVIEAIESNLQIKLRKPYRVYWDIATQPEIKANSGYRKAGTTLTYKSGELSEFTWGGKNTPTVTYYCAGLPTVQTYDSKFQHVYADYLQFRICTSVMQWAELKLPLLIAGTYKVWICWRRVNPATFKTIFMQDGYEDQTLPTVVDLSGYWPSTLDDDQALAQGWKQYNAKTRVSVVNSKLIGTITVNATGRHTLRFEALSVSKDVGDPWDMIQFIPVDEDQVWPRIDMEGNLIDSDVEDCKIFPDDGSTCITDADGDGIDDSLETKITLKSAAAHKK
jgi:uncharacterized surface protein with fasciclin (FAS1) repeats